MSRQVALVELGHMAYKNAWLCQEELFRQIVQQKIKNGKSGEQTATPNFLLFVEHPHVFTLGKNGNSANLLVDELELIAIGAEFVKVGRGGDITYHGPGQIVCYPIFDLENFDVGIHQYVWQLEEVVIRCLSHFGIEGFRLPDASGVWVGDDKLLPARKIASIGVRASRHVTMHGLALNVNTDLAYFRKIIPCGMPDKTLTSLEKERGHRIDIEEVKLHLSNAFIDVFQCSLISHNGVALPELSVKMKGN